MDIHLVMAKSSDCAPNNDHTAKLGICALIPGGKGFFCQSRLCTQHRMLAAPITSANGQYLRGASEHGDGNVCGRVPDRIGLNEWTMR